MAYLSQEQIRQILQNAPSNLDKGKIIAELAKTNTLQGYNEPAPQQDGFFKSLIKDPVKELIVRPGVRIAQAGIATLGGARGQAFAEQDQTVSLPVLGDFNIPAQKAGISGVKQIGGDALKSASYLYTPKFASTAITGAKTLGQTTFQAGLQTAKVGALTGAAYNAGDSLQKNQGLGETLKNTAIGGVAGGAIGFATGATISAASNLPQKMKANTIARYDELFASTKSGSRLLDKSIGKGKSPSQFLVDHNLIVDIEKGKIKATPTIQKIQSNVQPFDEVLDNILKVKDETIGTKGVSLNELGEVVKRKLASNPQNRASGYLNQQLKQVDDIIGDLIVQYGDDVNYQTLNQIKQAQWQQASVFDATRPNFAKDIHYNFGTVAKDKIQVAFKDQADIQGLNNYIGSHFDAIKNLQLLDGKAIKGGRLGTYFGRVIGAAAGASHGPIGSIAGAQIGDTVANVMQNTYISNPIKKIFLARLAENQPAGSKIFLEAQKALQQLQKESVQATAKASVMSTKYGLPAPDRIYAPGVDKTSMKVLPSDVSIQRNPKTGKMQKVFMGTSEQAKKGTGPIYQIKKAAAKVNDSLNEVTPGLSIKNTPSKSLISEARKYKSAEELGIKTEEGGHLLDSLKGKVDTAKIDSAKLGNEIRLDARDLQKQTTGKLTSDYWLKKIKNGERPPILVGVEDGKLKVIDGNHRATAYAQEKVKDVPVIYTNEAKSQLTDIWKKANEGIGKKVNNALNEVTPGLYTNSKYNISFNQGGSKKVLKNLSRDEAKSWAQYFKEKGLKFTVKTLGTVATAAAVKKGTNR